MHDGADDPRVSTVMKAVPRTLAALVALFVHVPTLTLGQPTEAPPTPVVVAPRLVEFVEATYPPEAEAAGLEATVELILTIAIDGAVVEAEVATRVGNGFDEAALEAARRFRFTPATRDGVPTAARIRYRYVFERTALEPTVPDEGTEPVIPPDAPGRISGRLLAEDARPVVGADVVLTSGESRRAVSADDGTFVFDGLPAATYALEVTASALGSVSANEDVVAGTETAVLYRMTPTNSGAERDVEPERGIRAVVDPPAREVTRRTISREVLTSIPGTRGDALRAVEILPGVGRPAFGFGALIVRGAAPGDSEILLDGIPVPLLYHFGGLTSFMNSRLLERIDFYPGNFSSRFGRRMGGILEVTSRDPATDRLHGVAELSAIDASVLLEGPLTENLAMAGSFRRSTIDLVFAAVIPDDGSFRVTAAPVYYDYQHITTWRPTDRDRIKIRLYGSSDAFRLVLGDDASSDPDVRGAGRLVTRFNFFHASWDRTLNERTEQSIILQTGPTHVEFGLGDTFLFDGDFVQTYGRAEWRTRHTEHVRTIAGADVFSSSYNIAFRGPPPTQSEGGSNTSFEQSLDVSTQGYVVRPGAYFDIGIDFDDGDGVLNIGTRLDYYGEIQSVSFDPRIAAQWEVLPGLKLKAGVGLYSQPPEFQESNPEIGNENLQPIHSLHTGMGLDYQIDEGITVGLEGFYKYIWNRVVSTEDGEAPNFINEGIGRIYGAEVSGRIDPRDRNFYGFLSYTLMRSERQDHPGDEWRLFDFDQTHIFTAAFVYRLPRHWELGGTLRFVTGNPYTPVVGAAQNPLDPSYLPINGPQNSARNPYFNRLDIRVEKQWYFDRWKLAFFLDIQNVYNRANQEGITYSYDYQSSEIVSGLPIIPALGIRGEL